MQGNEGVNPAPHPRADAGRQSAKQSEFCLFAQGQVQAG